jgi:cytochrome c-type protein NapB
MRRNYATLTLAVLAVLLAGSLFAGDDFADDDAEKPKQRRGRLFFGAPPTIPHDAGPDMNECLVCHDDPEMGVPLTPHPTRLRCRQCHVAGEEGQEESPGVFRPSQVIGLPMPATRAWKVQPSGPPVMPHQVLLREKCLACHAPEAREEVISTTHPERLRCRQCHVPQRPSAASFPPKPKEK